jgi:2-polyprenyl-3-methyl-5-hydroxy-6-metoxy-1,4-benzoquinol methylase
MRRYVRKHHVLRLAYSSSAGACSYFHWELPPSCGEYHRKQDCLPIKRLQATLKQAESYTFFRMVGALDGKRVLDLACGFGFYPRLLKQHGAAQVVGVDISPEMIRLATQQE